MLPADVATGPATLTGGAGVDGGVTFTRTRARPLSLWMRSGSGAPDRQAVRVHGMACRKRTGGRDQFGDGSVYIVLYGTGIRHLLKKPLRVRGEAASAGRGGFTRGHRGARSPGLDQVNLLLPPGLRGVSGTVTLGVDCGWRRGRMG